MHRDTQPMELVNSRAAVDRIYAETGAFQWARESAVNAIEAGATRIYYGLDWNGVEATGTYRRFISDDGCGMTADELVTFFKGLGATSKSIGGAHDNYGIGAKVSLLPWNTAGLLVASWKHGEGNVIWARADRDTQQFGLRLVEFDDDETVSVWPTDVDDPELGFNLEQLKPDWVTDHGTVLLLLGDRLDQHTILNDPRHDPPGSRQLDDYLNSRFWTLPDGVQIHVDQVSGKQERWPRERTRRAAEGVQRRPVHGARAALDAYNPMRDTVTLADGTRIHWHLRAVDAPSTGRRDNAYIAALYRNELYEHRAHHTDYRTFGIGPAEVRKNLWLIVEPPLADAERRNGAFPEQDRNGLLWNNGQDNKPLPWALWSDEWIAALPGAIRDAIRQQQIRGGEFQDEAYKERLAAQFGDRWRIERFETDDSGSETVMPDQQVRRRRKKAGGGGGGSLNDSDAEPTVGASPGDSAARPTKPRAGIPTFVRASCDDFEERWMLAQYVKTPDGGQVMLNADHAVIRSQVLHWIDYYPHDIVAVEEIVTAIYGECACAAIAHSEQLKRDGADRPTIDEQIRSPAALTLALLGLWPHDALISQRLVGKLGRRRAAEEDAVIA